MLRDEIGRMRALDRARSEEQLRENRFVLCLAFMTLIACGWASWSA